MTVSGLPQAKAMCFPDGVRQRRPRPMFLWRMLSYAGAESGKIAIVSGAPDVAEPNLARAAAAEFLSSVASAGGENQVAVPQTATYP